MPRFKDIDWQGLQMSEADFAALTHVDAAAWQSEIELHTEWFTKIKARIPEPLRLKQQLLALRLPRSAAG
jgi:phosphoenolpyruvate carboxykinase (GTP)